MGSNNRAKKNKKNNIFLIIIIKIIIITLFVAGYFYTQSSFSNDMKLLAVTESSLGEEFEKGSVIDLKLKVRPGSGNTYVNLKTIEEIDTQISIINSQKIACRIFDLDCDSYDFYYSFDGDALVLKGPSASSAIGILVAKTLIRENIDPTEVVITGSLNSGGIIGSVGGVDKKIIAAEEMGFKKALIPYNSKVNVSNYTNIEVIKVFDIVDAFNEYSGEKYSLSPEKVDKESYQNLMKDLGIMMCNRSNYLKDQVNFSIIKINSTEEKLKNTANQSFNSAMYAKNISNYYSMGSFCYNSNINYRRLIEHQKNISFTEMNTVLDKLLIKISNKSESIMEEEYRNNLLTINDFYTYLLVTDRINEAKDFIIEAKKVSEKIIKLNSTKDEDSNNSLNNILKINSSDYNSSNENITSENISINTSNTFNVSENSSSITITIGNNSNKIEKNNEVLNNETLNKYKSEIITGYSFALERFMTVELWESFIQNEGEEIYFNDEIVNNACFRIKGELQIKAELLNNYGLNYFNEDLSKIKSMESKEDGNKILCIYKGLELDARMNTVLNSIGIPNNQSEIFAQNLYNFTGSRISLNTKGNFPLIPTIYYEYAGDLMNQNDTSSSILYSNYALSYSGLNIYLEEKKEIKPYFNYVVDELYGNILFVIAILILIAFYG